MTAFLHDVAGAALPVAIVLLIAAAAARAVLWAQIDDERAQRVARQYLEPLSTWCLVAVGIYTLAASAAGDADALSLALPLALGVAAVLLRSAPEADRPAEPEQRPTAAAARAPAAAPGGLGRADRPLWQEPVEDESTPRAGLWSR